MSNLKPDSRPRKVTKEAQWPIPPRSKSQAMMPSCLSLGKIFAQICLVTVSLTESDWVTGPIPWWALSPTPVALGTLSTEYSSDLHQLHGIAKFAFRISWLWDSAEHFFYRLVTNLSWNSSQCAPMSACVLHSAIHQPGDLPSKEDERWQERFLLPYFWGLKDKNAKRSKLFSFNNNKKTFLPFPMKNSTF